MNFRGEKPASERPSVLLWQKMALLGVGYFVCAWLGRILSGEGGNMISYWLPAGLFVATLLLNDTRCWPWLMLAVVPANALFDLLHDRNPDFVVIGMFCVANIVQAGTGAWLTRRLVAEKPVMASLTEFFGLMFFAGVIGSAIGASLAAMMLTTFHLTSSFTASCKIMWGGDMMAVLVLAPLILVFFGSPKKQAAGIFTIPKAIEAALIIGGLAVFLWLVLTPGEVAYPQRIPALLFILWAGIRFGSRGGTLAVFLLAIESAFLTTHYSNLHGPPASDIPASEKVFALQIFVAVAALVGLVPGIVLDERDRTMAKSRESEEKFSKAFRASLDSLSISDLETGRFIEVNQRYSDLYGYSREEMLGRTSVELGIWGQTEERRRFLEELKKTGNVRDLEVQTRTRAGGSRIVQLSAETIELEGKSCLVSLLHDVTERIQADEAGQAQRQVLEMIANGQPMTGTLEALLRMIEAQSNDMLCSIVLLGADGVHLRQAAAPSLPADFYQTVDGQSIGPCAGSCGTAAYRREPVFVADIASDPLWVEFKRKVLPYGLRACWSTPIFDAQRKVLGTFAVYHRQPGLPNERHRHLISMVTHTAAICISRHRAEADREAAVVREQQARIEYTLQLIASQEAERKRIAAELHDSMGQNLLLIKNLAEMSLRTTVPAQAHEHLATINHLAAQCIAEARQISRDLHPYQLDHLGLQRALEAMLEHTAQASNVRFTSKFEPVDELFSGDDAMNIYRIVQECLNNILKHARARHVDILLERDLHEVQLRIADDGIGFDVEKARGNKGLGLKNITERVRMLGGKCGIVSSPSQGTRVEVAIPVKTT